MLIQILRKKSSWEKVQIHDEKLDLPDSRIGRMHHPQYVSPWFFFEIPTYQAGRLLSLSRARRCFGRTLILNDEGLALLLVSSFLMRMFEGDHLRRRRGRWEEELECYWFTLTIWLGSAPASFSGRVKGDVVFLLESSSFWETSSFLGVRCQVSFPYSVTLLRLT